MKTTTITDHLTPAGGIPLQVLALGEPGHGGAHFQFEINGFPGDPLRLTFQQGDPREKITGITSEALLAVLIARQRAFQSGPCPSNEGGKVLKHLTNAMKAMHERTADRADRGVEGRQTA